MQYICQICEKSGSTIEENISYIQTSRKPRVQLQGQFYKRLSFSLVSSVEQVRLLKMFSMKPLTAKSG